MNKNVMLVLMLLCAACGCRPEVEPDPWIGLPDLPPLGDFRDVMPKGDDDGLTILNDRNFEYDSNRTDGNAFRCKAHDATIIDLNDFLMIKFWNEYLQGKSAKLSKQGAKLLAFFVNAQCHVADALAMTLLTDMVDDGSFKKQTGYSFKDYLNNKDYLNSNVKTEGKMISEFIELKNRFLESNVGVRSSMRDWATIYRNIDPFVILTILNSVRFGSGGMIKHDAILMGVGQVAVRPVDIGAKWRVVRDVLTPYMDEMRRTLCYLKDMRYAIFDDTSDRKFYESVRSKSIRSYETVMSRLHFMVYDLPFCIESYRAYGKLNACKGAHWYMDDNEEKMKNVLREYSLSISVIDMLKGIGTPHAASCYSENIKFAKDELGERQFRDFANEAKLYRVTMEADESGKQSNKFEKW